MMCCLDNHKVLFFVFFFFFNDTATTEIYTLSLHDALPICTTASGIVLPDTAKEKPQKGKVLAVGDGKLDDNGQRQPLDVAEGDRKSTRLNSSHANISYAVFCLKKKKRRHYIRHQNNPHGFV